MPLALALGGARVGTQLDRARQLAEGGIAAGFIPNQDFETFRRALATALEESHDGWQQHYLVWFRENREDASPGAIALKDLYYTQPQINNVPGYVTKATKAVAATTGGTTPRALAEECLALFREFVAWHGVYVEHKGKIATRGDARLAPAAPREVNPNQIRATCSCCFRKIAVASGGRRMSHHGYTRPSLGWQTASCMGVAYPPFESSADGTRAYRQAILNAAARFRKQAAKIREGREPLVRERSYAGRVASSRTVNPSDPDYPMVQRAMASEADSLASMNEQAAQQLAQKIAAWVHVTVAGLPNA
jgi:hypothetical protein